MSDMTSIANTDTKSRTITLTDRPPVTIREDQWPCIAEAILDDWYASSGIRRDAGRITEISLRVRQHDDGRAIVYGIWEYTTRWQGERDRTDRAGVLLPAGSDAQALVEAIRKVGSILSTQTEDEERIGRAVRECIADMPAEVL